MIERAHKMTAECVSTVIQLTRKQRRRTVQRVLPVWVALFAGMQSALADDQEVSENPEMLEQVVVSAHKRAETLQDVPLSIAVVTAEQLADQNLDSLEDVTRVDPSVRVIGTSGRSGSLFMRGIGSGGGTSFDEAVGVFVDDIYHGRGHQSSESFLDIERVETLKGPQSIYFGNNAIAGAFNIVTKQPTADFGGSVRALYGQFGQYEAEAALNAPISDRLQSRIAVMASGEGGWATNVVDGQKYPDTNNVASRITLRALPSDDLDATLKVEGARDKSKGGLFLAVRNCPPPAPYVAAGFCKSGLDNVEGLDTNLVNEVPGQEVDLSSDDDVLTVHYRGPGNNELTSVTGFSSYRYLLNLDTAGTSIDEATASQTQHYEQFSQELRLSSPLRQPFEYTVGLYFQSDQLNSIFDQGYFFLTPTITKTSGLQALLPYLPIGQSIIYKQSERVHSAFASGTLNVTETLKIGAGLRQSVVSKDYDWRLTYGTAEASYGHIAPLPVELALLPAGLDLGTPGTLSGSRSDHAVMPSSSVQYQLNPSAMAYLSYSKGFLAGGFNADDTSDVASRLAYSPEYVDAYEVGLKSEWLDHRAVVNVDMFRSIYSSLQVAKDIATQSGIYTSEVRNVAKVLSQGVEAEFDCLIDRTFRIAAGVTYLDAHYTSYPDAVPTVLQTYEGMKVANDAGRPTPYDPRWSGSLTGTYKLSLPGHYFLSVEVQPVASSDSGLDVLNHGTGAYVEWNGRLTLEQGPWKFDLIGKNLTNRDILLTGSAGQISSAGTVLSEKEMPKNVVAQFRYNW